MFSAAWLIFYTIIGISLYCLFINNSLLKSLSLHPYSINRKLKFYTTISSGFVHANIPHLIFNLFTYYFFAFALEKKIGVSHFLILYFGSLVLSDLKTIIKYKNDPNYFSLGASGAISAIIFSYICFNPYSKISILFIPFGIPAPFFAILYLLFCMYSSYNKKSFINHDAHLWGALTGLIYTFIFFPDSIARITDYFYKFYTS